MKVRDILRVLKDNGWYLVVTEGKSSSVQAFIKEGSRHCSGKTKRRFTARNFEQYSEAGWTEALRRR
jgi:hypothetical protein